MFSTSAGMLCCFRYDVALASCCSMAVRERLLRGGEIATSAILLV